ncbi:hypothetical protein VTN77DRAFT_1479 [Rasamsonia byssochlamydoides]|uniref:uncharacterized protein n=1 Tax=Rasamsonia byssochlamydoides TaxID=89139 RepID=UPI00374220E0
MQLRQSRASGGIREAPGQGAAQEVGKFPASLDSVWGQGKISALEKRLDGIRKQLDTTLLFCLREHIEAIQNTNSPQRNNELKAVIEKSQQWQAEVLDTIYQDNWHSLSMANISLISTKLDESAQLELQKHFQLMILARLEFPGMPDRQERICRAYRDTFEWIYQDPDGTGKPWANFVDWTRNEDGNNIYWITGKPGSGKSTLMKFLYQDTRTTAHLQAWAGQHPLVTAGFFFWNSGTAMQMSRMGLLQSLLHQVLQARPDLIISLFETRWKYYNPLGGRLPQWTWEELRRTFNALLQDKSLRFCFFIDGLDEFDGDHSELVGLIINTTKASNVKVCAASRPWLVFEDAFESRPSLLLEHLTHDDIKLYVTSKFSENKQYTRLESREPESASKLVENVVSKASGVFLWVYLVVQSLLQGLTNSDRMSDMQRRLDIIPTDLEELFDKILNSLEPFYFNHACQLMQIVRAAQRPLSLLGLYYADEEDPLAAVKADVKLITDNERLYREDQMRRRLKSSCKGLLETLPTRSSDGELQVEYLHRTVKDFIESPRIWSKITRGTDELFNPHRALCNSFLFQLKTLSIRTGTKLLDIVGWCIEFAIQLEADTGEPQVAYLDEVDRTADTVVNLSVFPPSARKGQKRRWTMLRSSHCFTSFLNLAAAYGLVSYVQTKIDTTEPPLTRTDLDGLLQSAIQTQSRRIVAFDNKRGLHQRENDLPSVSMIAMLLARDARRKVLPEDWSDVGVDNPPPELNEFCRRSRGRRSLKSWLSRAAVWNGH